MSNAAKALVTVLLFTLAGLIVGLIVAPSIVERLVEGAFTRWTSLGTPPEPIRRLVGYEFGNGGRILVRVEADSGTVYQCCRQATAEWQAVSPSELVYADPCQELPSQAAAAPRPTIACVEAAAFEWVTDRTQFTLLDDGSVWSWHHRVEFAPGLVVACQSAIISGMLGVGVVGVAWSVRQRRQMH